MEVTMTGTTRPARCYQEFCCNTATVSVRDHGQKPGGWIGTWGFCTQHAPVEPVQA